MSQLNVSMSKFGIQVNMEDEPTREELIKRILDRPNDSEPTIRMEPANYCGRLRPEHVRSTEELVRASREFLFSANDKYPWIYATPLAEFEDGTVGFRDSFGRGPLPIDVYWSIDERGWTAFTGGETVKILGRFRGLPTEDERIEVMTSAAKRRYGYEE